MVYFAKSPLAGRVKTRLCPPLRPAEAAALYGAFLQDGVRPVPGARTLVYGWPPDDLDRLASWIGCGLELRPQHGDDLWERLAACVRELLGEGHACVVVRNTDSPDLPVVRVQEAIAAAAPGRVVLGPDQRGGFYLIAVSAPCDDLLLGLPEGDDAVLRRVRRRAQELGLELVQLTPELDVDTFEDLMALWRSRGRRDDSP